MPNSAACDQLEKTLFRAPLLWRSPLTRNLKTTTKQCLSRTQLRLYLLVEMLPAKMVSIGIRMKVLQFLGLTDDPNIPPNYRPWILRPITLVILALLPLVVLAITEYLFHCSVQQTGIFNPVGGETRLVFRSFVSQFFSLLVLVLAGLFFQDLDLAVKTMEPFYHLSKAEGANGVQTLLVYYFRPLVYFTRFQAASYSHWAVVCSSLAYIISTNVLPTLALGVFGVAEDEDPMDPVYTHCLGAFCVVITLLNLLLWYILGKRRPGLLSFPDNLDAYIELSSGLDPDNSLHELFRPWIQHDDIDEDKLRTTLKQHRFRLMRREADLKSPLAIVLLTAETPPDRKLTPPSPLKKLWK